MNLKTNNTEERQFLKMNNSRLLTFVTNFSSHGIAGLESQIYEEYVRLSKQNSMIIITENTDVDSNNNLKIIKVSKISIPKFRGIFKILQYVFSTLRNSKNFDTIYVRTFSPPELLSAIFAKKFLKKKVIFLIPGTWIFVGKNFKNKLQRKIFQTLSHNSDILILYSKLIIPEITSLIGPINESKISIIRNSIDALKFLPVKLSEENSLLYVGRIHPLKQIDDIIYAIALVNKVIPNVKLKIVGKVQSIEYYKFLNDLILKLGCKENIDFVGPIPNEKIVDFYNRAQIFILMGKNEGIPRSILEAMACEKAVIAAANSGIPDVIKHNENGILVENSKYEQLSQEIISLLQNDQKRKKLGVNARKTIIDDFNWNLFVKKMNSIFNSI